MSEWIDKAIQQQQSRQRRQEEQERFLQQVMVAVEHQLQEDIQELTQKLRIPEKIVRRQSPLQLQILQQDVDQRQQTTAARIEATPDRKGFFIWHGQAQEVLRLDPNQPFNPSDISEKSYRRFTFRRCKTKE